MGGIRFFSNVSGIDFRVLRKDDESDISAASSNSLRFSSLYLFVYIDLINNWMILFKSGEITYEYQCWSDIDVLHLLVS